MGLHYRVATDSSKEEQSPNCSYLYHYRQTHYQEDDDAGMELIRQIYQIKAMGIAQQVFIECSDLEQLYLQAHARYGFRCLLACLNCLDKIIVYYKLNGAVKDSFNGGLELNNATNAILKDFFVS